MCSTYNSEKELVVPIRSGSPNDDLSEVQSTRYYNRVVVRYDSVGRLSHFGDNRLTLRPIILCTDIIGATSEREKRSVMLPNESASLEVGV